MGDLRSTLDAPGEAGRTGSGEAALAARLALPALLLGAAAIGFAPIFVRMSELGPVATAFHRLLFALPALWLWRALELRRPRLTARAASPESVRRGARRGLLVAGLCFAGDLALWHASLRFTSVANATLFPNFAPVFVSLAGFLLYGERFSRRFLLGMAVAIGGAVVLLGESLQLGRDHLAGDALALSTALFYAGYIVAVGRLRASCTTAQIMLASGVVTALALLPLAILSGEPLWPATLDGVLVLVGLGLFSHALGQGLIAWALAHLPAAFSAVALLFQPAVAAGLAWLLLGEALGPVQAVGAVIILVGIALARPRGPRPAGD